MSRLMEFIRGQIQGISDNRNIAISTVSGCLFGIGWWIMIGSAAVYPSNHDMNHAYHVCGVVATVALIMVNCVSNERMQSGLYSDSCMGSFGVRVWLFVGFLLSFVSVIASLWILFEGYVLKGFSPLWPGIAVVLQNVLILAASMLFKFGRIDEF